MVVPAPPPFLFIKKKKKSATIDTCLTHTLRLGCGIFFFFFWVNGCGNLDIQHFLVLNLFLRKSSHEIWTKWAFALFGQIN